MQLSHLQQILLNNYQQRFPLVSRPYLQIAEELGVTEIEIVFAFEQLIHAGLISRLGAVIKPNQMGHSCLVAMQIPPAQLITIANMINQYSQVNHNYARDHEWNLWFVIIADNENELNQLLSDIEVKTGFSTMRLPLIKDYFINLGFELNFEYR